MILFLLQTKMKPSQVEDVIMLVMSAYFYLRLHYFDHYLKFMTIGEDCNKGRFKN